METVFSGEGIRLWIEGVLTGLLVPVFTPANIVETAMQIPALVGSGFAAWWIYDFISPAIAARLLRSTMTDYAKWICLTLASLLFPALWTAGLWTAMAVSLAFGWPHNVLRVAINLLAAWTVIRVASILVRDAVWSRAIALIAYTAAALNILHLLAPLLSLLDRFATRIGTLRISLLTMVEGLLALAGLLWLAVLISRILERRIQKLSNLTPSVQVLVAKLLKATMITLAVTLALTAAGIDLTALAVIGGAIGVGVGFGLQRIASNLISGVILLMDRSIKPGDIIQVGETYGWVSSLGARYVSVETRDGTEFLIPNEDIITQQVINWSHRDPFARIKVNVRVSFQSDLKLALDLLVQAASRPPRVLTRPEPRALLLGFGEDGAELELRFWISDVQNGIRNVSSEVLLEVWDLFRAHGIVIPYPQRDIHIQGLPAGAEAERPSLRPVPKSATS
ncbi:MAG TPA: mechanosensitive ion channel domain-containing protein [Azospirillaceae bacterium]|nr:mechanosensitive ion channel domain-containing protein [Azospirillaceae bacterium]